MPSIVIPSAYADGYAIARKRNEKVADMYVRHTTIGDPELDPVIEELSSLSPSEFHQHLRACMLQNELKMLKAPQILREFFENVANVEPEWVNHRDFIAGERAFYKNADLMLVAFVTGVLVEGFATLIAKSFNITKRVEQTHRRLMQNNRQLMEIFYPRGLERKNDGWHTSARVRFVHAKIRHLLANSDYWDHDAWGTPLSAAHLGYAICTFSQNLLEFSRKIGVNLTKAEQQSILDIWRYSGYVMGIPESILYATGAAAIETRKIGFMCEPEPTADSVVMANNLINSIPSVAGIADPKEQADTIKLAYRLSRALIGNKLANQFNYPHSSTFLTLFIFKCEQQFKRFFNAELVQRSNNFTKLLELSVYEERGLSYKLPDHPLHKKSSDW